MPWAQYTLDTGGFLGDDFNWLKTLNIEYPPAMQSALGWNNNCGTDINIEALSPINPKALRAGRTRNRRMMKCLLRHSIFLPAQLVPTWRGLAWARDGGQGSTFCGLKNIILNQMLTYPWCQVCIKITLQGVVVDFQKCYIFLILLR